MGRLEKVRRPLAGASLSLSLQTARNAAKPRLMHHMRTRWPEESLLVFLAFDLLHQDGLDFA
jgi:hypothetical protein